jgi:hypothetical protein
MRRGYKRTRDLGCVRFIGNGTDTDFLCAWTFHSRPGYDRPHVSGTCLLHPDYVGIRKHDVGRTRKSGGKFFGQPRVIATASERVVESL